MIREPAKCRAEEFPGTMSRTCSSHPTVVISSPCGMFDAVCGECEYACDEADAQADWDALSADEKAAATAVVEELRTREAEAQAVRDADVDGIPF